MHRRVQRLETRQMAATLAKLTLAGVALAAVCWAGLQWVLPLAGQAGLAGKAGALFATIALAGAAFFGVAFRLRIEELDDVAAMLKRKLGRSAQRA
jgi:hypothetical protein